MKTYRVDHRELERGAKHELEHTDSIRTARRIARDHLREHPNYYKVLPVAEKMMARTERMIKPMKKKPRPRQYNPLTDGVPQMPKLPRGYF
jgi:hypothetical protein